MVPLASPQLQHDLERHVSVRTGRRVRNLSIELHPDRIILRGQATSYFIKQMAQHGVWEILPEAPLENTIVVDKSPEVLAI